MTMKNLTTLHLQVTVQTDHPEKHLAHIETFQQAIGQAVLNCIDSEDECGCSAKLIAVKQGD